MKKPTTHILMTLLLLMVWHGEVMATSQIVTLKLYQRIINTTGSFNVTLLNQQSIQSSVSATYNCSDDFIAISDSLKIWDNKHSNASNINFIDPAVYEYYYEINIPKPSNTNEKYWVGKQIAGGGGFAFQGVNIFSFKNVKGKILLKGNQATFKYVDDLYFGAWIPPNSTVTYTDWWDSNIILGTEPNLTSNYKRPSISAANNGGIGNASVRCDIGRFIYCESCVNVEIEGFNIDGSTFERNNNANTAGNNITDPLSKIGGKFGDVGWQTNHNGISIAISLAYLTGLINNPSNFPTQTLIKNCNTYNLGLDGFEIQNYNVSMENCNSYNNCRQGLSWVGGDNFTALNCNFYNQAKILNTSPGAGIDIEPEIKYNGTTLELKNGKFINCEVYDNGQMSVINFGGTYTNGVEFTNCKFSQPENYTLMAEGKKIKFTDCEFRCMVWKSNNGNILGDETKFYNCDFYDIDKHGVPLFNSGGGYVTLYDNTNGKRTLLDNCRFHIDANEPRSFIRLSSPYKGLESEYTRVKNCEFIYNQPSLNVDNPANIFSGVRFSGKNKFISNNPIKNTKIGSYELIFEGGDNNCETNRFLLDGNIEFNHSIVEYDTLNHLVTNNHFILGRKYSGTSLTDDGNMAFAVKNGALVKIFNQVASDKAILKIGINSNLNIENGGKLIIENQKIDIEGDLNINKNSSYNVGGTYINKITNSDGKVFISTSATNLNSFNSLFDFANSTNPPCLFGGLTTNPCATNFSNIATANSLSILYNVIGTNPCNKDIQYQLIGASATATILLDGVVNSNNPITNVPVGMHTLTVIDGGCETNLDIEVGTNLLKLISKENVNCNADTNGKVVVKVDDNNAYSYTITGSNQQNTTGVFTNIGSGTYTITASNGNTSACAKTIVVTLSSTICCDANYTNTTNNKTVYDNMNSWSLSTNTISNQNILVNGIFTIDNNMSFTNCHFYFTTNSLIIVNNYNTLNMNNCTLQGACGDYWNGIENEFEQGVVNLLNCTVQDMSEGLKVSNNATLQATNNTFVNNRNYSIILHSIDHYNTRIWNNTFTSNAYMIPYNNQTKAEVGIAVVNSNHINIGDEDFLNNNGNGNHFSNLNCGIYLTTTLQNGSNQIGLYNNDFTDIYTGIAPQINIDPATVYNTYKGTGIYIDYSNYPAFKGYTDIRYTDNMTPTTPLFSNCTKAIINKNSDLNCKFLNIDDCSFGIMNSCFMNRTAKLSRNKIMNTYLGIQLAGMYDSFWVHDNEIKTKEIGFVYTYQGADQMMTKMFSPLCIDAKHYVAPQTGKHTIIANKLNIPCKVGKAIANLNASVTTDVSYNTINFTAGLLSNSTAQYPYIDPSLYGAFTSNSNGVQFFDNNVSGITNNLPMYQATYSKGMYFEKSKDCEMECNSISYTKQGLYAWGDNTTAPANIKNNHITTTRNPIYTLDNANILGGTFGDIGDGTDDNQNYLGQSGSTWLEGGLFKVWRNSSPSISFSNEIRTSTTYLTSAETGSNIYTNRYIVPPANNYTPITPCPINPNSNIVAHSEDGQIDWSLIDIEIAEDLANQTQPYINYEEVGEWMTDKYLYHQLSQNPTLMSGSTILTNFYNNFDNSTINAIQNSDISLATLFDFSGSYANFINQYNEAMQHNNDIVSSNSYEINERVINITAMKIARFGANGITETEKLEFEVLANMCPFIGGDAVYKARTLQTLFNPLAQYNDRVQCIPQTQNRGIAVSENSTTNLDSLDEINVSEQANFIANQLTNQKEYAVSIYPNPATDYIEIKSSQENGIFILMDITGKEIINVPLQTNKEIVKLSMLSNGTYMYKLILKNNIYNGKITVEK